MSPAPKTKIVFKLTVLLILAALVTPGATWAAVGAPQECAPSSSCTVGEFLYDDSYTPITDATCTLTSRYPDGSSYQDAIAMTGATDGWYSKSFTTPATTGLYRAQICCTSGTDYMCLDKTFEVKTSSGGESASTIASAVWGYSGRTLSSFGTLASDIWANSTRTVKYPFSCTVCL